MIVSETGIAGLFLVKPELHVDARGMLFESFRQDRQYSDFQYPNYVQDNFSRSQHGVLRGLHFQSIHPQGKLITCLVGEIYDVVVDLRHHSPTYGMTYSVRLSSTDYKQLVIPPGFAHGFCVLSEWADVHYTCTEYYQPNAQAGICWSDPDLGIDWPLDDPQLSEKDAQLPRLRDLNKK